MDRQARIGDTVLVKSREMTGRRAKHSNTAVVAGGGGVGVTTTENPSCITENKSQDRKYLKKKTHLRGSSVRWFFDQSIITRLESKD
jgi:hypothetical protein